MIIKKYNRRYIKIPYAYKEQNELKKPIEEKQKKDWTKYIDLYGKFITILTCATSIIIYLYNNSDYLQKARKYGHFTGYKN